MVGLGRQSRLERGVGAQHLHARGRVAGRLDVGADHEQARARIGQARRQRVGTEQREERHGDGAALERAEERAVEGQGGLQQQADPGPALEAGALEEIGEAGRPRGEVGEGPLLAAAVGELQPHRDGGSGPAVHALVGEVEACAIAVDEPPQRRPGERLDRFRIRAMPEAHRLILPRLGPAG